MISVVSAESQSLDFVLIRESEEAVYSYTSKQVVTASDKVQDRYSKTESVERQRHHRLLHRAA